MEAQNQLFSSEVAVQPREFYLDIDEAAGLLGISRAELLSCVEHGTVPGHKLWHGNRFCWKFKRNELADVGGDDHGIPKPPIQ